MEKVMWIKLLEESIGYYFYDFKVYNYLVSVKYREKYYFGYIDM